MELYGLLFTFLLGLFILIGTGIVFLTKNNDKFVQFSLSIALGVMITLISVDLLPEVIEIMTAEFDKRISIVMIVIFVSIGLIGLKILDRFIPEHDEDGELDNDNLHHIGIVSSIALVLHNIIEGMAIYSTFVSSFKLGLMISIGVGLHNIPLGMVIASTFYKYNNNKKKTALISLLISLSTFLGGLVMYLLSSFISELLLGILLSITLGMVLYIVIFELLLHVIESKYRKISIIGFLTGMGLMLLSLLF